GKPAHWLAQHKRQLDSSFIPDLARWLGDATEIPREELGERCQPCTPRRVSDRAAAALVQLGGASFDTFAAAIKRPEAVARESSAWAFGALHDARAVPLLTETVQHDAAARARSQAAWALGAISDRSASPALMAALHDADAE